MTSLILVAASRVLMPLLLLFSLFLLVRGHNAPGGGFVGGLVASCAFALYGVANGAKAARLALRVDPRTLVGVGLALALGSGLAPLFVGAPFLTGLWLAEPLPVIGKAGTPILFDTGVYMVVLGVVLLFVFTLGEE